MVRKENIQARGNSLLQTATSKRAGPGRFASLVLRGTAKPPVKKVDVTSSDASRVSDMTASIVEDARLAVIKEVKIDDFEVESSVLEMSVKSGDSALKALTQESPLLGNQEKTTPQPPSFRLPPRKEAKPMEKRLMEIQPGIRITTPSPMSLDRIQVQMGQEHAAPASADYIRQEEEKRALEEMERQREERTKAKREVARKLKEDIHKEIGEGFEALLEDDPEETTPAKKKSLVSKILGKIRPKSPKKMMTADVARAMAREAIARSKNSKGLGKPPLPKRGDVPLQEVTMNEKEDSISDLDSSGKRNFPVREILMSDGGDSRDDESISTLGTAHILERMRPMGSSNFFSGHDDGGVRDPTPFDDFIPMDATEMFHPPALKPRAHVLETNALIDQIDSGSLTENAGELTGGFGRCGPPLGRPKVSGSSIRMQSGLGLAAACINEDTLQNCNRQSGCPHEESKITESNRQSGCPHEESEFTERKRNLEPPEIGAKSEVSSKSPPREKLSSVLDAAISSVAIGVKERQPLDARADSITDEVSHFSSIDIKKTLSPIDEEFSPINGEPPGALKSMPELEEDTAADPVQIGTNDVEKGDVIDLTDLASPVSPTTQDGVKGDKGAATGAFSFDTLMDLAASRLKWNNVDDRYAVEGEESPCHVIRGHSVEGDVPDGSSIPVVQGVEISSMKNLKNEVTPRASGSTKSPKQPPNGLDSSKIKPPLPALASEVSPQSSFEVYEHPEGDIVMWSENPIQSRPVQKNQNPTPNGFTGHFSDGLFDLLSMDESVSRGRKKVPFLSVNNNDREVVGTNTDSTGSEMSKNGEDEMSKIVEDANSQVFTTMSTEASDKRMKNDEKSEVSSDQEAGEEHEKMDPSLGIMCGAVPLYFMYKNMNRSKRSDSDSKKTDSSKTFAEEHNDKTTEVEDSAPLHNVQEDSTISPKPQPKGFLPMASPKKDHITLQAKNDISTKDPSNDTASSSNEQKEPAVREKVLLDNDDAYWDTLSTIASTKDKRSVSGETFAVLGGDPGPIPVEITMDAPNLNDGVSSRKSTSPLSEDKRRTTGFVIDLVGDEKSSDSLSRQLNNIFAEREVPVYSEAKHTEGINEVRLLGKARTANVRDAFHAQHWQELNQSHEEYSSKQETGEIKRRTRPDDSTSAHASANRATAIPQKRNSYLELGPSHRDYLTYPRDIGASAKAGKSGRDDVSEDNSGLLLAITRTEGDDDDKSSKVESHTSRHETNEMWSRADLDEILMNAMQDQACNDLYDGAKEVFQEAKSHIVSTQNTMGWSQPKIQHQSKSLRAIQEREDKLCDDFYDGAKAALDEATSYIIPTQGSMAWPQQRDQQRSNRSIRMAPENDRRGRGTMKGYPPKTSTTTTPSTQAAPVTSNAPSILDNYIPKSFGDVLNANFLPSPTQDYPPKTSTTTTTPSTQAAPVTSNAPSILDNYIPKSFGDVLNANFLPSPMQDYPPKTSTTTTPPTQAAPVTSSTPSILDNYVPKSFGDVLNTDFLRNPWNNSTRSVSWGFEEIYEEATEVASDVPQQVEPLPETEENRNKAIMSAAAEAAATTAALGQINTPIITQPGSSGIEPNTLSDIDEEELISRTLQLSKQLLASMTLHDLEGADNEVVKSLMSFGTEDGKLSLPEISRDGKRESPPRSKDPPLAALFTDSSSDEETATQDKSSLTVVDPAEAAVRTAIPESVRVSKPKSISARVSTAGDTVSFSRALDVNIPQTTYPSDMPSVRSRSSLSINPRGSFSNKSWNRSHSESIDQVPPTSALSHSGLSINPQGSFSNKSWNRSHSESIDQVPPTSALEDKAPMNTSHANSASIQHEPNAISVSTTSPMNPSSSFSTSHGKVGSPSSLATSKANHSPTSASLRHVNSIPEAIESSIQRLLGFSESQGLVLSPSSSMQVRSTNGSPTSNRRVGSSTNSPTNVASHQDGQAGSPTSLSTSKANLSPTSASLPHVNSIPEAIESSIQRLLGFSESQGLVLSPSSSMQIRSTNGSPSSNRRLGSSTNSPTNVASHQDESSGFSELFGLSLFHSRQEIRSMNDDSMTPTSILRRLGSTPHELSSEESSCFYPLPGPSGFPTELEVSETSRSETLPGSRVTEGAVQQPAIFHVLNRPTKTQMMHQEPSNTQLMRRGGKEPIEYISDGTSPSSSSKNPVTSDNASTWNNIQEHLSSEGESQHTDPSARSASDLGQNSEQELRSSFTPSTTKEEETSSSLLHPNGSGLTGDSPIDVESVSNPTMSKNEETSSSLLHPNGSGVTENSPIDVESVFKRYDRLANHLIEENANLKERALTSRDDNRDVDSGGMDRDDNGNVVDGDGMDENLTAVSSNSSFNVVLSRLDQLRAQREKAVAVLQKNSANRSTSGNRVQGNSVVNSNTSSPREKNRLSRYATRPGNNTTKTLMMMDLSGMEQQESPSSSGALAVRRPLSTTAISTTHNQQQQPQPQQQWRGAAPDIETSSTSSDRTTPSMKARELRRQLDEALQASHTIRKSQEQLGRELATFKNRFYRKSEELEDQAFRAMGV